MTKDGICMERTENLKGDDGPRSVSSVGIQEQYPGGKGRMGSHADAERSGWNPHSLWDFLARRPSKKSGPRSTAYKSNGETFEQAPASIGVSDSETNEFQRFEVLRNELIELENRVQNSPKQSDIEEVSLPYKKEEIKMRNDNPTNSCEAEGTQLVHVTKKENIIERSLEM